MLNLFLFLYYKSVISNNKNIIYLHANDAKSLLQIGAVKKV